MKFTRYEIYGLQIALHCAARKGKIVNRTGMCLKENIPDQFCAKIAQDLSRRNILKIHRGSKGGLEYIGKKDTDFKDIIEALSGSIDVVAGIPHSEVRKTMSNLNIVINDFLENIVIEDIS